LYFSKEEYAKRWNNTYREMGNRGYQAAVIWGRSGGTYDRCSDVLYLSNFYSTNSGQLDLPGFSLGGAFAALIFAKNDEPELHMDMPNYQKDLLATNKFEGHKDVIRGVADALNKRGIQGKVALVGSDFLPVKYARYLEGLTRDISWIPEDNLVQRIRRIKSARELECYRHAGKIVSQALNKLFEGLTNGKTEAEAAADAAYEVTRRGGRFHMIPVSHGDSIEYFCRNPLAGFSEDAPKPGDLVRGWVYGPIYQGYWLCPGRTTVTIRKENDESPVKQKEELVKQTAEIVERLLDKIRPGTSVLEVANLGDKLIAQAGGIKDQAADLFPLYGHGVGLFWEEPWIMCEPGREGMTFEANMVLGVEAFMGKPGIGSAGFEQNIIVHEDGNELLTTTPMTW
jgi:Xaa-Pro aminopeptidase